MADVAGTMTKSRASSKPLEEKIGIWAFLVARLLSPVFGTSYLRWLTRRAKPFVAE